MSAVFVSDTSSGFVSTMEFLLLVSKKEKCCYEAEI